MDLISIVDLLRTIDYWRLAFKAGALIISVGYLIYATIFLQQQNKMEKNALIYEHLLEDRPTDQPPIRPLLYSFSLLQLTLGLLLMVISLFLL